MALELIDIDIASNQDKIDFDNNNCITVTVNPEYFGEKNSENIIVNWTVGRNVSISNNPKTNFSIDDAIAEEICFESNEKNIESIVLTVTAHLHGDSTEKNDVLTISVINNQLDEENETA